MQWASDEGVEDVASGDQVVDRRADAAAFLRQAVDIAPSVKRFAQQIQSGQYPGDRSTIASAASGITHVVNTCLSPESMPECSPRRGASSTGLSRTATDRRGWHV
ncbi:hypothetical protein [Streptomyces sp. NPDC047718]|uniref:imine reductase family protein n=1 Tax=Streptomyces sp. NPDC047718 TaxID=3155479 RepID=UPI0033F62B3D